MAGFPENDVLKSTVFNVKGASVYIMHMRLEQGVYEHIYASHILRCRFVLGVDSWVTSATLAAVAAVSVFRVMKRNCSRVSLGPNGGCFYDMKRPGQEAPLRRGRD